MQCYLQCDSLFAHPSVRARGWSHVLDWAVASIRFKLSLGRCDLALHLHRNALHSAAYNLILILAVIVRPFAVLDALRFNAVCLGVGQARIGQGSSICLLASVRFVWCHIGPCEFVQSVRAVCVKMIESISVVAMMGKMAATHLHLPKLSALRQGRM